MVVWQGGETAHEELPTVVADIAVEEGDIARLDAGEGACADDDRVELICLDDEDDHEVVKGEKIRSIFKELKQKRKIGKYHKSPYTNPPDTTPRKLRRRSSRINHANVSPAEAPDFADNLQVLQLEPFVENLSRGAKAKKTRVTVPAYIKKFFNDKNDNKFIFPWGDTIADHCFWQSLLGTGAFSAGWLRDEVHVWVDLMWALRPSDAHWAITGAFFSASVMHGNMRSYWANGLKYPAAWCDVEKILFPINEPNKHWALGELHIRTGVVTIYDSLLKYSKRQNWWKYTMPETFALHLPKYLNE